MYLIDGNNVIGATPDPQSGRSPSRLSFLRQVAQFSKRNRKRCTVVFDGAPEVNIADGSSFQSVRVLYSRPGGDADERIIAIVEAEQNRKAFTVVTSDSSLTRRIRLCGVRVVTRGAFIRMLEEALADRRTGSEDQPDVQAVNEWMRYFGIGGDDDSDEV